MADVMTQSPEKEAGNAGSATGKGYFAQHEEIDSSASRGVYSFAEDRQEQVLDAMRNRRTHDTDEQARLAMERTHAEEMFGQRQRFVEEEHAQRMRVLEQNTAINNQLLMLVAAAMGFAALGTQNADQAQMNAQVTALAGILAKALTAVPPVSTATGQPGTAAKAPA